MVCDFCDDGEKFKHLRIKEYDLWTVSLHANQCYLGRSIVSLNRHLEDLFDINEEEAKEFFLVTKKLRTAIQYSFGADLLNYVTLGNVTKHVHLHVIPRYPKKVSFAGWDFEDKRWGQNYAPYDKEFKIPRTTQMMIRETLKLTLGNII